MDIFHRLIEGKGLVPFIGNIPMNRLGTIDALERITLPSLASAS